MSRAIVLKDEAVADMRQAMAWYDSQRPGLGDELLDCVNDVLTRIAEKPQLYPMLHKKARRALVRRFPYAVFYVEEPDRVVVIAVMHAHRNPRIWRGRA